MEYQKIINLLDTTSDNVPRFITKKWIEVHDQSGNAEDRYKPSKQIIFKTVLRTDLCDFSDAYIVVKGTVTVTGTNNKRRKNRLLAFKNNGPFISCIFKTNNTLIYNAEKLDVAMPMYNLIEYNNNYRKTTDSSCNYYTDELTDDRNNNNFAGKNVITSESFKYKTSVTGSTYNVDEIITNGKVNEIDNLAYDVDTSGKKK